MLVYLGGTGLVSTRGLGSLCRGSRETWDRPPRRQECIE
jgi:hypothetical protein